MRSLSQLVLTFMKAQMLAKPEVFIGGAAAKFGHEGECIDETTRVFVGDQMASFQKWIHAEKRMTVIAA